MDLQPHETHAPPATHGILIRPVTQRTDRSDRADHEDDVRRVAQALWEHHLQRLVRQARQRLDPARRRIAHAQDAAMEAFIILCGRLVSAEADEGRVGPGTRPHLWQVLARLAALTALTGGTHPGEPTALLRPLPTSRDADFAPLVGREAPVEFTGAVAALFARLRDTPLRTLALRRICGLAVQEIATEVGISVGTVERKLAVIAAQWGASEDSP